MKGYFYLLILWAILSAWNLYIGLYRTHVDRVRAGLSPSPQNENRLSNLISSLLAAPNQDRPFRRGCVAVLFANNFRCAFFITVIKAMGAEPFSLSLKAWGASILGFALAFLWERVWAI